MGAYATKAARIATSEDANRIIARSNRQYALAIMRRLRRPASRHDV
jgi:hypothetical protein